MQTRDMNAVEVKMLSLLNVFEIYS